jgi:hypothetical protein
VALGMLKESAPLISFAPRSSKAPASSGLSYRSLRMSGSGPGRVETFFVPKNCKQPGTMDLDATVYQTPAEKFAECVAAIS